MEVTRQGLFFQWWAFIVAFLTHSWHYITVYYFCIQLYAIITQYAHPTHLLTSTEASEHAWPAFRNSRKFRNVCPFYTFIIKRRYARPIYVLITTEERERARPTANFETSIGCALFKPTPCSPHVHPDMYRNSKYALFTSLWFLPLFSVVVRRLVRSLTLILNWPYDINPNPNF